MAGNAAINRFSPETKFIVPSDRLYEATRAWLIFLQGLFKSRPVGMHKWHPNITETEIVIQDQNPSGTEPTNKRPIITTARGPAGWAATSLSQHSQPDFATNKKVISDIITCSITISVMAREGLEAQDIAYSIFRMIPVFKPSIMRLGRMHAIGNSIQVTPETQQGAVVPGSSSPEWKMVQLIIPFYIQDVISADEKDFYTLVRDVNLHMGFKE